VPCVSQDQDDDQAGERVADDGGHERLATAPSSVPRVEGLNKKKLFILWVWDSKASADGYLFAGNTGLEGVHLEVSDGTQELGLARGIAVI
jgi:hypothetical protein